MQQHLSMASMEQHPTSPTPPPQNGHPQQVGTPFKAFSREGGHHPIFPFCTKAPFL